MIRSVPLCRSEMIRLYRFHRLQLRAHVINFRLQLFENGVSITNYVHRVAIASKFKIENIFIEKLNVFIFDLSLQLNSKKTAVKNHILACERCKSGSLTVNDFKVVQKCSNEYETKIQEALIIKNRIPE